MKMSYEKMIEVKKEILDLLKAADDSLNENTSLELYTMIFHAATEVIAYYDVNFIIASRIVREYMSGKYKTVMYVMFGDLLSFNDVLSYVLMNEVEPQDFDMEKTVSHKDSVNMVCGLTTV